MMSEHYELINHWDDWFSLPANNWSSIEGNGDEWLAIADAIERGDKSRRFKRCAFYRDRGYFVFSSPRNCSGDRDVSLIPERDSTELVKAIRNSVLRTRSNTCIEGDGI